MSHFKIGVFVPSAKTRYVRQIIVREMLLQEILYRRTSNEATLAAAVCLMLAILFTGSGIFALQKNRIFATSAVSAKAEVVELVREETVPGAPAVSSPAQLTSSPSPTTDAMSVGTRRFVYIPVFQYRVNGTVFEHRAARRNLAAGRTYSVGDTTTIYYNPENPADIRDILSSEATTAPSFFGFLAGVAWFLVAMFTLHSFRLAKVESSRRSPHRNAVTETKCTFIALEATNERVQNARLVRVVCRWVHPETGTEWLLRSSSLHPTALPAELELGSLISCKVDFDNPKFHEISLGAVA